MENNYDTLDLDSLTLLYEQAENKLRSTLLAGASWEIVAELRKTATELAITIHKRLYALSSKLNPAESRQTSNDERKAP